MCCRNGNMDINSIPEHVIDQIVDRVVDRLLEAFGEAGADQTAPGPSGPRGPSGIATPSSPEQFGRDLTRDEIESNAVEQFAKAHPELDRNRPADIVLAYLKSPERSARFAGARR